MENDSVRSGETDPSGEFDWTKLATLATVVMAFATMWLAGETQGLKLVELSPHIAIADVQLQIIDDTGTPIKQITWLDGEQLNKASVHTNVTNAILAVKFSNSGKSPAYVKWDNYPEVLTQCSTNSPATSTDMVLVPGGGYTGWSYGINIIPALKNPPTVLPITYKFSIYDINGKFIEQEKFIVTCNVPVSPYGGINPSCSPSYAPS